jgi:hypothetical protein
MATATATATATVMAMATDMAMAIGMVGCQTKLHQLLTVRFSTQ